MNNRKQILKNMKKEKKLRNTYVEDNDNYIGRFIGTIGGILLVLVISYFVVGIFITKTITFGKKEDPNTVTIDNNTILIGNIFTQSKDEYYVVIYDSNNKDDNSISNWVNYFKSKNSDKTIYVVDSKNKMNGNYMVEKDSNKDAKTLEDLKVVSPTLLKIVNGEIKEYYEGKDEVKSALKN